MYRQVDGVALGSPLGLVLANIFVGYCKSNVNEEKWPSFYARFVDTFSIFPDERRFVEFFTWPTPITALYGREGNEGNVTIYGCVSQAK